MKFSRQFTRPKKTDKKKAKPVPVKKEEESEDSEEQTNEITEEEKQAAAALVAALTGGGDDDLRSILMYGDVNEERSAEMIVGIISLSEQKPKEGRERLDDMKIYVSTYGGSADDMMSIYDIMRLAKNKCDIQTIGMGKVMSAGTLILAAGTKGKRKIMKNCRVMIHAVSAGSVGPIHNLQNEMEEIQAIQDAYIRCLVAETDLTKRQLKKLLDQKVNIYLTAEEAVEYGLADEVI
jgi:ATP-dependent Clp protease protease subunit|tara:strand:- start:2350 stop:3057 length:708 start_codon:yes stop_codon:yes gene_type:complete